MQDKIEFLLVYLSNLIFKTNNHRSKFKEKMQLEIISYYCTRQHNKYKENTHLLAMSVRNVGGRLQTPKFITARPMLLLGFIPAVTRLRPILHAVSIKSIVRLSSCSNYKQIKHSLLYKGVERNFFIIMS